MATSLGKDSLLLAEDDLLVGEVARVGLERVRVELDVVVHQGLGRRSRCGLGKERA